MATHDTFYITVRGIIFNDGKLFCQKLRHNKAGQKITQVNDFWATPGGHLEVGESLTDGLRREMVEETGVEPIIGPLLFTQQFRNNDDAYIEFFYHITNSADYETLDLASTSHGALEVVECGFIHPAEDTILPKFLTTEIIESAIANGTATNYSYL